MTHLGGMTVSEGAAAARERIGSARPNRPRRLSRTHGAGLFARRQAERITREEIVRRAAHLPAGARALVVAHYDAGMPLEDLAVLHQMTRQQVYRLVVHWRDVISEGSFLLAAHFAGELPTGLAEVARDHWLAGHTLRQVAREHGLTLHEVRTRLAEARVELLQAAARLGQAVARGGAGADMGAYAS